MTVTFSLEKILQLAKHLGNPQDDIPEYIHIVGIQGKTSTALFLTRLLQVCANKRVGTFVYPPPRYQRDCILINGVAVDESRFRQLMDHVEQADAIFRVSCTPYEKLFLTAILIFRELRCAILVIESAMGGQWDATNILDLGGKGRKQKAVIVTSILRDHTKFLGYEIETITNNLLGVKRDNSMLLFSNTQPPEAIKILNQYNRTFSGENFGGFKPSNFLLKMLPDIHQDNIEVALRTFQALYGPMTATSPTIGIFADMNFPHTASVFYHHGKRIIVDSAQNVGSSLCKWIQTLKFDNGKGLHFVLGISHKDEEIIREFLIGLGIKPYCKYSFIKFHPPEGYPWIHNEDRETLKRILKEVHSEALITDLEELNEVMVTLDDSDITVITGSPHIVKDFNLSYLYP